MSTRLTKRSGDPTTETVAGPHPEDPAVGRWYWYRFDANEEPRLGCVVHMGSNFAELECVDTMSTRILLDDFWTYCKFVPEPDAVIDGEVQRHQKIVQTLMAKVSEVTARLAIGTSPSLPSGSEVQALALRSSEPLDSYKAALILARKETLPDLFKQIENANKDLAKWMQAKVIPLRAQANGMRSVMEGIENRIFSVELYAGLVETVEQVRKGEPAGLTEKIHLLQRRAYMDEECLAQYETGGMSFRHIRDFDRWLAKPVNMNRLLPFPKCVVAFRVRREEREYDLRCVMDYVQMIRAKDLDKKTFLYIRNGDQLFRLSTEVEFEERLFPDMNSHLLAPGKKLWIKSYAYSVESIITDDQYQGLREDHLQNLKEARKHPREDRWHRIDRWPAYKSYSPFTQKNVYYDDGMKTIRTEMEKHNRLVLILQGLLDRSPVFHPHPVWSLWSSQGFSQALTLIYDDARALTTGDKPDFEAYRAKLNASLKKGSITVGQEIAWEIAEAEKERRRRAESWREREYEFRDRRYRPYGNPGPGTIARVAKYAPRAKACTYEWTRERRRAAYGRSNIVEVSFTAPVTSVLNVDAYVPGDFKRFFNDPRTRAEYLQWAPLLLEAEEYHAGNRKLNVHHKPWAVAEEDEGETGESEEEGD